MSDQHHYYAPAPRGVAPLLADELRDLGATDVRERQTGVGFVGPLALGYRVCLWSRLASRVLLQLAELQVADEDALYDGVRALDWADHLASGGTLAVSVQAVRSPIRNSHYAALRVKDAVVDQLRERHGERPSVDLAEPELAIHLYLSRDRGVISLDLAGQGLHRRGYRAPGVEATLKENLAAAILLRAGWPAIAEDGGPLLDPLCGSGTLAIEGAMIAADRAPGLLRDYFGFLGWRGHDVTAWAELVEEARERWHAGRERVPAIVATDHDPEAVRVAWQGVEAAGLVGLVHVERRELAAAEPPAGARAPGLLVVDPPYGERMGADSDLAGLYASLGRLLRERFAGWQAAVFTGNPALGKQMGLRAHKLHKLYNGPLECRLLHLEVTPRAFVDKPPPLAPMPRDQLPREPAALAAWVAAAQAGPGAQMFANRLRKNLRTLGRWADRRGIDCYRLYDADIPEYNVALDLYRGDQTWVHLQEYAPPRGFDEALAVQRLDDVLAVLPELLGVPPERVAVKVRERQRGRAQYDKFAEQGRLVEVRERGARLLVNLFDRLDTGLYLDHRDTRALIEQLADGHRFANLFSYTGVATVFAARGGARDSLSLDLSRTYLDWAERNLALNGLAGHRHRLLRVDVLQWLDQAVGDPALRGRFGLVFCDPPSFSRSKGMRDASFDVQRDHPRLLDGAASLLAPGGVLLFSTHARQFSLRWQPPAGVTVREITDQTLPRDFARPPKAHRCWRIERVSSSTRAAMAGDSALA